MTDRPKGRIRSHKYRTDLIPKTELLAILDTEKYIEDNIIEVDRWSILHSMVFEYNGKIYRVAYHVGATEQQPDTPWEFDLAEVECFEVAAVEVKRTEYRQVPK
jgi:hypothetical protein